MDLPRSNDGEARFSAYVEGLTSVIGHADRTKPLRDYCLGLMMPCERKSVEPIAIMMRACRWPIGCICRKPGARTAPGERRRVCPKTSSS